MMSLFRGRWLDVVTAIYIYNEHRGYTALHSELLVLKLPILFLISGVQRRMRWPDDDAVAVPVIPAAAAAPTELAGAVS